VTAQENWLTAMDQRFTKIEGDFQRLIWMAAINLVATVGVIFMLLRH
jgi:hypothetical protein